MAAPVKLRFATRYDRWLVLSVACAAVFPFITALSMVPKQPVMLLVAMLLAVFWIVVLVSVLPQYYQVRADGLFLRQGWRRTSIPWKLLVQMQTMQDSRSAGVFSTQRVLVVTESGKEHLIAVAEEERFLEEVLMRCPQLEKRPFGLALPLAPPARS